MSFFSNICNKELTDEQKDQARRLGINEDVYRFHIKKCKSKQKIMESSKLIYELHKFIYNISYRTRNYFPNFYKNRLKSFFGEDVSDRNEFLSFKMINKE